MAHTTIDLHWFCHWCQCGVGDSSQCALWETSYKVDRFSQRENPTASILLLKAFTLILLDRNQTFDLKYCYDITLRMEPDASHSRCTVSLVWKAGFF